MSDASPEKPPLNDQVRAFWEREPCGTAPQITGPREPLSREWFEAVESYRYDHEPMIHAWAQFTRHRGKRMLEVGVGAGTDHLQWACAGLDCHGVDMTDAAIETTRARLACYGFTSQLQRCNAQQLPFANGQFDLVYSWGVIHHSEDPQAIINEIYRVLRPGGMFIGMMYKRRALCSLKLWLKHGLFKGRPWRSFANVLWHHMESVGTKAYTEAELRKMFGRFPAFESRPYLTSFDVSPLPRRILRYLPEAFGFFIGIRATK